MTRLEEIRDRVNAGMLDVETLMAVEKDMSDLLQFVDLMIESADLCTVLSAFTAASAKTPGPTQQGLEALSDLYAAVHEQVHTNLQRSNLE